MSPIVRMAYFVGVSFLAIIMLLCAVWWAALICLLAVYGPLEGVAFALGSISLLSIIYGMKHHRR